ncbi:MAG: ABC transporter permease [Alphaproteobacteria bacterium]|nr:ABC transporter permease [Alphaproteobacteria bacterium]
MLSTTQRDRRLAWIDLRRGVEAWNIWHILAMQELRQRYRRSVLGPLWISVSLAVQVAVMGFLVGVLFKQEHTKYLPYATLGIILWNFISTSLMEGANCFVGASTYLLQCKRPLFAFVIHVLWRNLVYLAHTAVIFVIVALIFTVPLAPATLLVLPGLVLLIVNMAWMLLFIGVIAARFRDVHMMLSSSMTVLFWVTPIVFYPEMLGQFRWITDFNPLAHLLEIVRAPLLGQVPAAEPWLFTIGMAVIGWIATFQLFSRFRARIPYWL